MNWFLFFILEATMYSIRYANDEAQVQNICQMLSCKIYSLNYPSFYFNEKIHEWEI